MTQSEILGFDTKKYASTVNAPGIFDSVREKVSKATSVLAGIFDNGINIYNEIQERIDAVKIIDSEMVGSSAVNIDDPKSENTILPSFKTLILGTGVIVAVMLIFRK